MKRLVLASVTSPSIMSLRNATAGLVTPIGAPPKRTVARPTRKNQIEPGRQAASPAADVSVFVSCCAREIASHAAPRRGLSSRRRRAIRRRCRDR